MVRPKEEIIFELEIVAARLQLAPNAILQSKMELLIKELDRANRESSYSDSDHSDTTRCNPRTSSGRRATTTGRQREGRLKGSRLVAA